MTLKRSQAQTSEKARSFMREADSPVGGSDGPCPPPTLGTSELCSNEQTGKLF